VFGNVGAHFITDIIKHGHMTAVEAVVVVVVLIFEVLTVGPE
jgi:hypothetical protein